MSNLVTFLTDLATNPHQQLAFAATPDLVLDAAGVPAEQRALLLAHDATALTAAFAAALPQPAFGCFDPGPDPLPDPDPSKD